MQSDSSVSAAAETFLAESTLKFYRHALKVMRDADVPALVGGAYDDRVDAHLGEHLAGRRTGRRHARRAVDGQADDTTPS